MITKLSENNISFFDKIIPVDELDNLLFRPDYFGIGVTRYEDINEIPAGVLIYRIDQDPTGLVPASIKITYLNVIEKMRRGCVGSDLITRLFMTATANKIETITIDTGVNDEDDGLRQFLAGWHFNFSPIYQDDFYFRLGDADMKDIISELKSKKIIHGTDFGKVTPAQFNAFKQKLRSNNTEGIDYVFYELDMSYFDPVLSKVVISETGEILAAFLVHENMGGLLELVLMQWVQPAVEIDTLGLMMESFKASKMKYGDEVYLTGRIRSDYIATLIEDIVHDYKPVPIFRGILTKDTEVTTQDWMGAKDIFRQML